MSKLVRGASVPLFDRLSSRHADSSESRQLLSPEELQASIGRELSRLLNTRSRLGPAEFIEESGTTIDYGIPDVSALASGSQSDLDMIGSAVAVAVRHYEPRLNEVKVKVLPAAERNGARLHIGGTVRIGLKPRQLSFELPLDPRAGGGDGKAA
jgi:type VI secretion system protein ImpF